MAMKKAMGAALAGAAAGALMITQGIGSANAWQDTSSVKTAYGDLSSNVWHDDGATSGNARKWSYQVSSVVGGKQAVENIKATWDGGADMRNSANFSITAGKDSVGVGGGSTWQWVHQTKYWSNTNGVRSASYRSNMVAMPERDYDFGTVALSNSAYVKFKGDARNWQILAAC